MNIGDVMQEYKSEIRRLEQERDVLRLILVDEVQFNRSINRDEAEARVDLEVFQKLQGVR